MKFKEYSAGEIQKVALTILTYEFGIDAWRQNNTTAVRGRKFIGRKGVGDLVGYDKQGRFVMCEVKKIGDTFSDDQKELLTSIHNAGGIALWATQEGIKIVVKKFID